MPTVSVIIPVWNVEPYLRECLDSVVDQTIGLDRLEIIAIDDGSSDGSGRILDEYAARHRQVIVLHVPNSGGPGRPRNLGLDRATGQYVFFLDADDYLGRQTLERAAAMADRYRSDIVLVKMVGVGGRLVPTRAFRQTVGRADLGDVYSTLTVLKLFRRSLIERLGLRFQEGLAGGEDSPFTVRAYLEAQGISVDADHDGYFARLRPGSQTHRGGDEDLVRYLEGIQGRIDIIMQYEMPQARRDRLMSRHIEDIVRPFRRRWAALPDPERRRVFDAGAAMVARYHDPSIQRGLGPAQAMRAHCLEHGRYEALVEMVQPSDDAVFDEPLIEGERVYARWPHFRDAEGIPDDIFDISRRIAARSEIREVALLGDMLHLAGDAYLALVGGQVRVSLRRWPRGPAYRFQTESVATPERRDRYRRYPSAGFRVAIDLRTAADGRPFHAGIWEVTLDVGTERLRRAVPLVWPTRGRPLRGWPAPSAASTGRTAIEVAPDGRVRLLVGEVSPLARAAFDMVDRLRRVRPRRKRPR